MDYDSWKMTDEEYMADFSDSGNIHAYEEARQCLKELLAIVYQTGDVMALEDVLDELSGILRVPMPKSAPRLRFKEKDFGEEMLELGRDLMKLQGGMV